MPADWASLRFRRFAVGRNHLSGEVRQHPGKLLLNLEYDGEDVVEVHFFPSLPTAARLRRVLVNGRATSASQVNGDESPHVYFQTELNRRAEVLIDYDGGVGIVPPEPRPEPGDRTTSLKVLRVKHDEQKDPRAIDLTLAGLGGRSYNLDLVTTVPSLTAEGATVRKTDNGYRLEISFVAPSGSPQEGFDYVTRQIRLRF